MPLVEKNDRVVRRSAKGQYTNVSNFRVHLTHYVKGGESSGYLCDVIFCNGRNLG